MSELIRRSYEDARLEATNIVRGYVEDLVGPIDYFGQHTGHSDGQILDQFTTAHNERLSYKALLAKTSTSHGLAFFEHYYSMLYKMKGTFERVAEEIEKIGDQELIKDLQGTRRTNRQYDEEYMQPVVEFFKNYGREIAAEKLSDEYMLDTGVIHGVLQEVENAVKFGQWEPEIITVADLKTGTPIQVELPSSEKLGRIANMAPQLKRLGFGAE